MFPTLMSLVLTSIIFFLSCLYFITTWNHDYWKKRDVPHARPFPFVGNLQFLMRSSVFEYFRELGKFRQECVGIYLAHRPALVVQTPELARRVLVKDHEHFEDRFLYAPQSDPLGSLNLFTVKNPTWSRMRRAVSPMFTSCRLRMLSELMTLNAQQLVARIQRNVDQRCDVELKDLFSRYTSDTVAFSVFGLRTSALNDEPCPLWAITSHMVKFTFRRGLEFSLFFLVPQLASLCRLNFFSKEANEYVSKLFWSVVEERQKSGKFSEKDLVHLLLTIKQDMKLPDGGQPELADNLMLAQAALFILGAVETSSSTLSHLLHELAYHPDEQEKLYKELKEAMEKSNQEYLDFDGLVQVKYLTSCIQETLRKYPPVPYVDRICNKEYKLNDNLTVERGLPVFVNVSAIHYDPEYYPEPEKWRPGRFPGDSDVDNRQFTFLPFGDGPRFCIGKRYGMTQIRVALAQVLYKYRVEPSTDPYRVRADPYALILSPLSGGTVTFIPRNE